MTDCLTDLVDVSCKEGLRLQSQRLILTYKGKICKEEYKNWFNSLDGIVTPAFLRLAHEHYKDGGDHTHVGIDFGRVFNKRNAERFFDYDGVHPNIKLVKTVTHWKNVKKYLGKEDPENRDLLEEGKGWFDKCMESQTELDAIRRCAQTPAQVSGVRQTFKLKIQIREPKEMELYPWQKEMEEMLEKEPDDRHVIWIFDRKGGMGKTKFCKWYKDWHDKETLLANATGGMRDFATIVKNGLDGGWTGRVCLLNLTRDCEQKAIYAPIEAVKDGVFTTTKYEGSCFRIPRDTWMVCFANFIPDINKLSLDRWRIYDCQMEGLRLLTLREAHEIIRSMKETRERDEE